MGLLEMNDRFSLFNAFSEMSETEACVCACVFVCVCVYKCVCARVC